jgi:hypothetical protein
MEFGMPTLPSRIGHFCPILIAILSLLPVSAIQAQLPPQTGGIYDGVQEAFRSKKYERSIAPPKYAMPTSFGEFGADGALLIGIQIALGRYNGETIVVGMKPVYGGANGVWSTTTHGVYEKNKSAKLPCRITEYVSLVAPTGSAVSKITLRKGNFINGLSLEYLTIGDRTLEVESDETTKSIWVGSEEGTKVVIDPQGLPVCGVCGTTTTDGVLRDVGLIHITDPRLRPPSLIPNDEWDEEEFWNSLLPKKPETVSSVAVPAVEVPEEKEIVSETEPASTSWGYLPYLVFGGVALPIIVVCYLLFGRQRSEDVPQVPVRLPGTTRQSLDIRASQGRYTLPELDLPPIPDTTAKSANSTPTGKGTSRWL